MKVGAAFPITAMNDPLLVRDFAQTLDGAGFDLVTTAGHLLAVPPDTYSDRPVAAFAGPFHDPFVLFGYVAAITQRLHFRTTILILPLYPTAIVAKQAAELQQLSNGRFELGVGISWNAAEYQALNQDFRSRGKRIEEQIEVLRRLWSEPFVTFEGRFHKLDGVGLNRVPAQPIPIWMGGGPLDAVLRRMAALADGWIPLGDPSEAMPRLRQYLVEAGRDPTSFGLTARILLGSAEGGGSASWLASARKAQELGATHLMLSAPADVQGAAAMLERLLQGRAVLAEELGA